MKNNNEEKDLNIVSPEDLEEVKETAEEIIEKAEEAVSEAKEVELSDDNNELSLDTNDEDELIEEKKKISPTILIIAAILAVVIVLVGAYTYVEVNTLAKYKGGRVTKSEFNYEWEAILAANGITEEDLENEEYAVDIEEQKNSILTSLANQEIIFAKLHQLGMDELTEEEILEAEETATSDLDNYATSNMDYILSTLSEDASEEEQAQAIEDFKLQALNDNGFKDMDEYIDIITKSTLIENAYYELLPDDQVAPSDEELQAEYDALLESQKSEYDANPNAYLNSYQYSDLILYKPEGIRNVRHVLIQIDDETLSEIQTLTYSDDQEGADELYEEALASIEPEAQEVLDKLTAGEITFDEAIAEYNTDSGQDVEVGYEVCEGYEYFVTEFTEGAMALKKVGDITGLVATSYGYHIIEYYAEQESETVAFEEVSDSMRESTTADNRTVAWYDMLDDWYEEFELTFKNDELNATEEVAEDTAADTVEE